MVDKSFIIRDIHYKQTMIICDVFLITFLIQSINANQNESNNNETFNRDGESKNFIAKSVVENHLKVIKNEIEEIENILEIKEEINGDGKAIFKSLEKETKQEKNKSNGEKASFFVPENEKM